MKKIILPCALAFLLGCGASVPPPSFTQAPTPPPVVEVEKPEPMQVRELALKIPNDWVTKEDPEEFIQGMRTRLIAQTPGLVGNRPITVIVAETKWEGTSEEFAGGVVLELINRGWPVKKAYPIHINDIPASVIHAHHRRSHVTQVNVAFDGRAYVAMCAADVEHKEAIKACGIILDTLRVESRPSDLGTL